jgi:hypothetical protein
VFLFGKSILFVVSQQRAGNPPEIRFRLTLKKLQLMPPLNQKRFVKERSAASSSYLAVPTYVLNRFHDEIDPRASISSNKSAGNQPSHAISSGAFRSSLYLSALWTSRRGERGVAVGGQEEAELGVGGGCTRCR